MEWLGEVRTESVFVLLESSVQAVAVRRESILGRCLRGSFVSDVNREPWECDFAVSSNRLLLKRRIRC